MRYYTWEYEDKEYDVKFTGTSKFLHGFNPCTASSRKSFLDAFHKAYPNRPHTDIKDIKVNCFKIISVSEK